MVEEGLHYAVYRGDGTEARLSDIVLAAADAHALFLGEEHDDVAGHAVQLELLRRLVRAYGGAGDRGVVLSMEMFERDVQGVVDEYLADLITEEHFLASSRPWATYESFYRPLVELAKTDGIAVVGANAPRRYVNRASRLGRESLAQLSATTRKVLPPLPYPEPSADYRAQWDDLMGDAARHMTGSPMDGQMLWDASMGLTIATALRERPRALVLHIAGAFHVERWTGVPETLDHYRPGTRFAVVAVRPTSNVHQFDPDTHEGLGDFVILTDENMEPAR